MSERAQQYRAEVRGREVLDPHLVRLRLGGPELAGFESTGAPDEWVGLIVPGQFQSRYYSVRGWSNGVLTLDVVVHAAGLVTEWVNGDCVGDEVTVTAAKGSFALPPDAGWLYLVGDLTALPAMARIVEAVGDRVPTHAWAETPAPIPGYFPAGFEPTGDLTWLPGDEHSSRLGAFVETLPFPPSPGYFWMAGESAQMRAIRRHLMRTVRLSSHAYNVMGYWRTGERQLRAVDPGPIYRSGKARGLSDDQIWAEFDAARE